jgi:hypothetical protein
MSISVYTGRAISYTTCTMSESLESDEANSNMAFFVSEEQGIHFHMHYNDIAYQSPCLGIDK